jgi:hypothetical protein
LKACNGSILNQVDFTLAVADNDQEAKVSFFRGYQFNNSFTGCLPVLVQTSQFGIELVWKLFKA